MKKQCEDCEVYEYALDLEEELENLHEEHRETLLELKEKEWPTEEEQMKEILMREFFLVKGEEDDCRTD